MILELVTESAYLLKIYIQISSNLYDALLAQLYFFSAGLYETCCIIITKILDLPALN